MSRPDTPLTPDEIAELGALLAPERPQPSEVFATRLDARVADRFAGPRPVRARTGAIQPGIGRRLRGALHGPRGFALAGAISIALVGVVLALSSGAGPRGRGTSATSSDAAAGVASSSEAARAPSGIAAPAASGVRKVEQSADLRLGAPADRIDGVARAVLAEVADVGGIVDRSNVTTGSDADGPGASFVLRIPSARLQEALGALSRVPHAHVLSRSDDTTDVNERFVSLRRALANERAERDGLLRALRAATSEQETLRLKARLDVLERAIATSEHAQRGLNARIAYSRVALTVDAEDGGGSGGHRFTPARALHDAGHVLSVTAGVILIAAAVLVPFALLLALAWPFLRVRRRRRREQALDAV